MVMHGSMDLPGTGLFLSRSSVGSNVAESTGGWYRLFSTCFLLLRADELLFYRFFAFGVPGLFKREHTFGKMVLLRFERVAALLMLMHLDMSEMSSVWCLRWP